MSKIVSVKSKKDVKRLWEEVFPEDVGGFSDFYFSKIYPADRYDGIYEGNILVSMAGIGSLSLSYYGKKCRAHMIRGVATKKGFGGRGYASQIIKQMLKDLYEQKEPFVLLKTFIHPFYERIGFETCSYYENRELCFRPDETEYKLYMSSNPLPEKTLREMIRLYNDKAIAGNLYKIRMRRDFSLLLRDVLEVSKGYLLTVYAGGVLLGYALLGGDYYAKETVFCNEGALRSMAGILCDLTGEPFTYKALLAAGEPDAMIRCVNVRRFLQDAPILEGEWAFRVKDDILPENTGVWKVRVRDGEKMIEKQEESLKDGVVVTPGSLGKILLGTENRELPGIVPLREVGTFEEY